MAETFLWKAGSTDTWSGAEICRLYKDSSACSHGMRWDAVHLGIGMVCMVMLCSLERAASGRTETARRDRGADLVATAEVWHSARGCC